MSMQPTAVRGSRPPVSKELAQAWLLFFAFIALVTPMSAVGWFFTVLVMRTVRRRGRASSVAALVAFAWLVLVVVAYRRHPDGLVAEHFTFYREDGLFQYWMARAQPDAPPVQDSELLARLVRSWLGFMVVGLPLGILMGSVSMLSRPTAPAWSKQGQAIAAKERKSSLAKAVSLAATPPDHLMVPPEAVYMSGDLPWLVKGPGSARWIVPPEAVRFYSRVVVGAPGQGKSHLFVRDVYTAALRADRVVFFDGKGTDPALTKDVVAAYLAGYPGARVGLYPWEPATIWRGTPRQVVQKLLAVWEFAEQYQFFEAVAEQGLSLAIEAPGAPPVQSSAELIRRLDVNVLKRLHRANPAGQRAIAEITGRGKDDLFGGFAVRMRSLLRALGRSLDGEWSFEDVDLAVVTVASGEQKKDADAILRVLLEDFGQYATGPRRDGRAVSLFFDEFSAMGGGRRVAINLTERLRSARVSVTLGVQSVYGLGNIEERRRILLASPGGVYTFQTAEPEELVKLAGSATTVEVTHNVDFYGPTDRGLARPADKFKLDPNLIRRFIPGEVAIIHGGSFAHGYVCTTAVPWFAVGEAERLIADAQAFHAYSERPAYQEGTYEQGDEEGQAEPPPSQECK